MVKKLKVDFHTHTDDDPWEKIDYNALQLIDRAGEQGFDALAITNHDVITYSKELAAYAADKGILLIPGVEAKFSNKHVLILNPVFNEVPLGKPLQYLEKISLALLLLFVQSQQDF